MNADEIKWGKMRIRGIACILASYGPFVTITKIQFDSFSGIIIMFVLSITEQM